MNSDEPRKQVLDFVGRRVISVIFAIGGTILAVVNLRFLLPGATMEFDGKPTDDIVLRTVAFVFPLVIAVLGVLMYRVPPRSPKPDID